MKDEYRFYTDTGIEVEGIKDIDMEPVDVTEEFLNQLFEPINIHGVIAYKYMQMLDRINRNMTEYLRYRFDTRRRI